MSLSEELQFSLTLKLFLHILLNVVTHHRMTKHTSQQRITQYKVTSQSRMKLRGSLWSIFTLLAIVPSLSSSLSSSLSLSVSLFPSHSLPLSLHLPLSHSPSLSIFLSLPLFHSIALYLCLTIPLTLSLLLLFFLFKFVDLCVSLCISRIYKPLSLDSCSISVSALSSLPYTIIATAKANALKMKNRMKDHKDQRKEEIGSGLSRMMF